MSLKKEWGRDILAFLLNRFGYIPLHQDEMGDGMIAGQAVASAIYDLFGLGYGSIYNDVDLFYQVTPDVMRANPEKWQVKDYMASKVVQLDNVGMYNLIWIGNPVPYSAFAEHLDVFDLNCVQCGIDLKDGSLVWTPAFEEFIATGRVLANERSCPARALLRYCKKKAEMPLLSMSEQEMERIIDRSNHFNKNIIPEKYCMLFHQYGGPIRHLVKLEVCNADSGQSGFGILKRIPRAFVLNWVSSTEECLAF